MSQVLLEKWEALLENDKVEKITNSYRKKVTAQLLENQEKFLSESAKVTTTDSAQNWDPVLISLVRRMAPKLIAYDVCGVQPMTGPTGLVFAMRARYNDKSGKEALYNEADTSFSGAGKHVSDDPFDSSYSTGTGKSTADGEVDAWNSMSMTIEKTSVTAQTRQLRADYSLELAQDLRAIHGLDAENELSNILSAEIISEINREVVRKIYTIAKQGAQFASTPGTFDLQNDADGRWSVERFKGLLFAIERDANAIAVETRRGKGNVIITSADVASALVMAGVLDYNPALQSATNLDVDAAGVTYAGQMGRFKVFVDPYLSTDGYVIGYKGSNAYDAGMFYCPYVPLQMVRATNTDNFQPAIGFKTRYGIIANPFTSLNAGENVYYRKAKVLNLM
ncbi:MAG: hypothetical protein ACPLYF_04140 [Fervidobacterium sp.]|jgi:hypothetical protein